MTTTPDPLKAAIVIDRQHLPIFSRRLKEAGFSYEDAGQITPDVLTLTVVTDRARAQALAQVVFAAKTEATKK